MTRLLTIAATFGSCNGVTHAISLFHKALQEHGAPVYILHELVHNSTVTTQMRTQGAVFVESLDEVPRGAMLLIGAHGISLSTEKQLAEHDFSVIDATCPLVLHLQDIVSHISPERDLILFGKKGHPESTGIISRATAKSIFLIENSEDITQLPESLNAPVFMAQSTMNHLDYARIGTILAERHPGLEIVESVCHATHERQKAVLELAASCDLVIIFGSPHSSNACRLREIAEEGGCRAILAEDWHHLPDEIANYSNIGISAGASTPVSLVDEAVEHFRQLGFHLESDK